jgi:hypothetical protein
MSIHSRLSNFEKSLQYRELALLWLKTAQGRSGFSDYWRIGEFQPWASENEEAGLMYHLAFEVNGVSDNGNSGLACAHELGQPAWGLHARRVTPVDAFRAGYGRRFPGTLAEETLHDPRRCSCSRASGGLDFRGVL